MDNILNLHNLIGAASRISIAVHTHPDGDALGSGTGLLTILADTFGKDAMLVLPDRIPDTLSFITGPENEGRVIDFTSDPEGSVARISSSDLIFCLDCNSFSRTASLEESLKASDATKVLIDHHLAPDTGSFDLVFSQTEISSTCELLFWTMMELPEFAGDASSLPARSAYAMMTGLTTDTNNFANSVFPTTFRMASLLIGAGVDRDAILNEIFNNYRENRLRLMGYMVGEKMKITSDGTAYMILSRYDQEKFDFKQGETEGFVNMPLAVRNVRMSIFLTEEENWFRVSVRSKRGTSANLYAKTWCNGGGHEQAAGGRLYFPQDINSPEDAEAYILETSHKFLEGR